MQFRSGIRLPRGFICFVLNPLVFFFLCRNVYMFRKLLSEHPDPSLKRISIIGIGGVNSKEAVARMRRVGASAVACATALGMHGVDVFRKLNEGL